MENMYQCYEENNYRKGKVNRLQKLFPPHTINGPAQDLLKKAKKKKRKNAGMTPIKKKPLGNDGSRRGCGDSNRS